MSAESDLKRYRTDAERLRKDISAASSTVADKRKKALAAGQSADKSKSPTTQKSKRAEADRLTKAANDAEKKRADLEKKLAATEVKVNAALGKLEKERTVQEKSRERRLRELASATDRAASQFSPPFDGRAGAGSPLIRNHMLGHDVFFSHASEDKDEIARPLKDALEAVGLSVWFDEIRIKVGQSIRQSIEEGISNSRFGVVIISPDFFAKKWTNAELDALFGKKMDTGENLVLPVWHHVSKDEVMQHSPLLAGILALNTAIMTVDEIAAALAEAVRE